MEHLRDLNYLRHIYRLFVLMVPLDYDEFQADEIMNRRAINASVVLISGLHGNESNDKNFLSPSICCSLRNPNVLWI